MKELKPSDFSNLRPLSSVLGKSEYETIALNIMVILKRTGNEFRELSYEEYESERKKDGNYSKIEYMYFESVAKYCLSAETAVSFSPNWNLNQQ